MRTTLFLMITLSGAAGIPAFGQPVLERSEPANGARDVPVALGAIRLHFDRPMDTSSWTLWQTDRGTFPPLEMGEGGPWRNDRTCEFRLKELAPATTYALQLNSDRRQGFRAAGGGRPLPVTVIVFTTASLADDKGDQSDRNEGGDRQTGTKHAPGTGRQDGPPRKPQPSPPSRTPLTAPTDLPRAFTTHRCIDNGGLRNPRSGQFLEAFRLLIPKGWRFQGGLRWVTNEKPPQQMTRADFLVPVRSQWSVSSPDGRCVLRSYPEAIWADLARTPAGQTGIFPPGSDYGGMTVGAALSPQQYITRFVLPRQRGLTGVKVTKQEPLPALAHGLQAEAATTNRILGAVAGGGLSFQASIVEVDYQQGGRMMHEVFLCALQYLDAGGLVIWSPRFNVSGQAPRNEYEAWRPYFVSMLTSLRINTEWLVRLQMLTDKNLQGIQDVDAYCRKIDQQIVASRRQTTAEIQRGVQEVLLPWASYEGPDGQSYYLDAQLKHSIDEHGNIVSGTKYLEGPGWSKLEMAREK